MVLVVVLLLLLSSLSLFGQPAREAVTIEVVDVPVFVTGKNGPIEGLTRDDFELYVNGKPQPIDYFDAITPAGDGGIRPDTLRERRLFLLMFDLAFMPPHQLGRAQKAAAELIMNAPPTDLFAVATFSSRRGVWFATPFTGDRVALGRGIASLSQPGSGDPLGIVMTGAERAAAEPWTLDAPQISDALFRGAIIDRVSGEALRDMATMQLRRAAEDQMIDFKDLASRFAALQGQKHVVLLSFGWDAAAGRDGNAAFVRRISAGSDDTGYTRSPVPSPIDLFSSTTIKYLRDMHEAFQRADILLHTLDMRGVATLMGGQSLYSYAAGTGGTYLHNNNDLGGMLVELSENTRAGYVLGFRPAGAKRGHNTIEVKLKNRPRNVEVLHRKGFSSTPAEVDVNEGLYLADVVLNDVPQTGTAPVLDHADGKLEVRVPLRPLSAQLGTSGKAELLVYVFGADDVALNFHRMVIDVPAEATGETKISLPLPEGATTAKALLRVHGSLGFSRTDL